MRGPARSLLHSTTKTRFTLFLSAFNGSISALSRRQGTFIHSNCMSGAEVHAVVQTPGPFGGDELITEAADVAVQGETLDINVSQTKDGQSRGVVAV